MKYSLLVLLTTAMCAYGQEGPFVVIENDSAIHHVYVAARNDSVADVFYQVGNDAYHLAFALDIGMLYAGPDALPNQATWQRGLEDVAAIDEGWAALVYDTSGYLHRTLVFTGDNAVVETVGIDSGDTYLESPYGHATWNLTFSLSRRVSGGFLADWTYEWVANNPNFPEAGWAFALTEHPTSHPDRYPWQIGGAYLGWARAYSLASDCTFVLGSDPYFVSFCLTYVDIYNPLYNCPDGDSYYCEAEPVEWLMTHGGARKILTTASILEFDSSSTGCQIVTDMDETPSTAVTHPDFGFAWLSQPSSGLLLNRADTMGTLVNPAGVVYWPEESQRVRESHVDMTANGKIVVVWTTSPSDTDAPTQLWIEAVDWLTPLSTKPSDFIPQPSSLSLSAYPNPFNSELQIQYELPRAQVIEIAVYNVLGQKVAELVNATQLAGIHAATWSAHEGSGIYFVQMKTATATKTQKVLLTR